MTKPSRPFGSRGGGSPATPRPREPAPRPPVSRPIERGGDDTLAPGATASEVSRTRKRSLTVTLVTMGALAAGGLALSERRQPTCVDDPTTPMIDESRPENCRPQNRATTTRNSLGPLWWHWRSSSGGATSRWFSGGGSAIPTAAHSTSSGPSSSPVSHSTTPRGGFGSIGSFHFSGGS